MKWRKKYFNTGGKLNALKLILNCMKLNLYSNFSIKTESCTNHNKSIHELLIPVKHSQYYCSRHAK